VVSKCPDLEEFYAIDRTQWFHSASNQTSLSKLSSLRRLNVLQIPVESMQNIQPLSALAACSRLTDLYITVRDMPVPSGKSPLREVFPSLRKLKLCTSLLTAASFIQLISPSLLQKLSIRPTEQLRSASLATFCRDISKLPFLGALEDLTIGENEEYMAWPIQDEDLELDTLQHLFLFKELKVFTLHCELSMNNLSDGILKKIGKAWPRLQTLSIAVYFESECTFLGLCYLFDSCSDLSDVNMTVRPTIPEPGTLMFARHSSYPQAKSLSVHAVDIEVDATVDFIRTRFPNLQTLSIQDPGDALEKWRVVTQVLGTKTLDGYQFNDHRNM
jgi:hypothetical protein